MPSVYQLKSRFQDLLRPLVARLATAGVTANQVTVAAMLLSLLAGIALFQYPRSPWPLLLLPVALLARMALNAIDGMLAREHGMTSQLGAVLNELGDVVSDTVIYLPLALLPAFDARAVVLIVVLAIIGELTGVLSQALGAGRRYDGPMGKSDRALLFGALALLIGLGVPGGLWLDIVLWLAVAASLLTIVNRARAGLAEQTR
ncbi:MAG: CDP-alcohol phosphatidyltransferase family protein [Gammaproteobacteria bacterium]|nr:CDP-alcohol phosphatidyltransferase family protein [Gammaproteobacteria bacterium]